MKHINSHALDRPAHITLAAVFAVALGAVAAVAQSTGASSSPSGTSTNPDRYGSGGKSSSTQSSSGETQSSTSGASAYGTPSTSDTSASAGSAAVPSSTENKNLGWGDRHFVTKAADSGKTELELAKIASQQSTNQEVKSYAQKLIEDHTSVNSELMSLASSKNVKLDPEDLGKERTIRRFGQKSGSEFDREFIKEMIDMHEANVKLFEKAARDAKDTELRAFAAKHVDRLRDHLQKAQSLRASIMPTGRDDSSSGRSSSDSFDPSSGTKGSTHDSSSSSSGSSSGSDSTKTDPNRDINQP